MSDTDLQLLARYQRHRAEDVFAEIVRRHLDLVFSAALRQVRSPQLAEEVAQSAFTDLARNAHRLAPDTILAAWLYQVTRRTAIDVVRRESRRQLREQIATETNAMNATDANWTHIGPLLDEAMQALDATDRAAVLLRYFENKSLREVGETLGASEEAARKRISRAVDRLREFFTKRGVTVGASGLVVVISTNAIQAAPVALAVTISTAAVITGTTIASTATATVAKTIAMTALQKTIVTATIAMLAGVGIYEARQVAQLSDKLQTLQQKPPLDGQIQQFQRERDEAIARQAMLQQENERLKQTVADVPKLRGEVAQLRMAQQQQTQSKVAGLDRNDPTVQNFLAAKAQADQIARYLEQWPAHKIPELKLLTDIDWLSAAKEAKFDSDDEIRETLSTLRKLAKNRLPMGRALFNFTRANDGLLPTDVSQLKPYFKTALSDRQVDDATIDAILARYIMLRTGKINDSPQGAWFIAEKLPVDREYDTRAKFGNGTSVIINDGAVRSYNESDPSENRSVGFR